MERKLRFFIPIFIFFLTWELLSKLPFVPQYLFPPFSSILKRFFVETIRGTLIKNAMITLYRVALGFLLGAISGILLGIFAGISEKLSESISPIIFLIYPIPSIGWIPVLMVWFGISNAVPIIAIFICSFFPIYLNTVRGVKSVDKNIINAARTMGTDKITLIKHVILPLSLPNIFTGLKLESGMSLRTGVVAEMLAIPSGLGYLLMKGESLIDMSLLFTVLFVVALLSLFIDYTIRFIERRLLKWQSQD